MYEPTTESAGKYRSIRKHLDNLGYRQALPLDALTLVEQLLADLIQTTESLKHFKSIAENNIETCSLAHLPVHHTQKQLTQECKQLHTEILEAQENYFKESKDLKRKIQELENDCGDLQLASSRNLKKIKDLELESSNKSKRIQELLGKCCKPTINSAVFGPKKHSVYPPKRPVLEGDYLPSDNTNNLVNSNEILAKSQVDSHIFDLGEMADKKLKTLTYEILKLKGQLSLQNDNASTMKTQLASKDKEILRLKQLLENILPHNALFNDCSCRKNDPSCSECVNNSCKSTPRYSTYNEISDISGIRELKQAKLNLEQQLRDALNKQHDAMSQAMQLAERNEELEKELRDIDHIALAVEADCNSTVKENNKRISNLQEKLENNRVQIQELEKNLLVEKRTSQELKADLEANKLEKRNVQRVLESSIDEKKQLIDRINQLTIIENGLNAEIDRLSSLSAIQKYEIVELQTVNNINLVKEQMHNDDAVTYQNEKIIARLSRDKTKESTIKTNITTSVTADAASRKSTDESQEKMNTLQRTVKQLEHDCNHYKKQWCMLNEKYSKSSANPENVEFRTQICDLKHEINDKEQRICELQRKERDLRRENFDLEKRQQFSRTEEQSPCNTCRSLKACTCPSATQNSDNGATKLVIAHLEHERDTARAEADRSMEAHNILHERLKLATRAHTSEQKRLRENLRLVENKLDKIEREKQEIIHVHGTQRSAVSGLEDILEDTKEELRRTKQELASQRTQYFQLRALQDQTDQALGDVQSQLNKSEAELSKTIDHNRNLEQLHLQLNQQVKEFKQEINTLRSGMARLDREKDQLLLEIDEKTERIAALERETLIKEQQTISMEQQLRDFQHKKQMYVAQSADQERQSRNIKMEMETIQRQLMAANADRDNVCLENRRYQDDLASLTCEMRTLQRELEKSRAESCDLKTQLQTYVSEVRRAEDLLNRKENERTEMLNHFRALSLDATVLESNNHSLESEAAEARSALQLTKDRLIELERQLDDKDTLIQGYEGQISELTQTVASLEAQLHQQMEQKARAEADLNAVRDLAVKLDQQKESLLKQLSDKEATNIQIETQFARLKAEQNLMHDQTTREHATVTRLQTMLDQSRCEAMENQKISQELQNEVARLKTRISELQSQLSAESAELRRYQNQAAEFDKQISDLRRQVTDERFKRSQKEEEHRRSVQFSIDNNTRFHTDRNSRDLLNITMPTLRVEPITTHSELSPGPIRSMQSPTKQMEAEAEILNSTIGAPGRTILTSEQTYKGTHIENDGENSVAAHGKGIQLVKSASCTCGPLCIKTSFQEDEKNKDITFHISDATLIQHALRPDESLKNQGITSVQENSEKANDVEGRQNEKVVVVDTIETENNNKIINDKNLVNTNDDRLGNSTRLLNNASEIVKKEETNFEKNKNPCGCKLTLLPGCGKAEKSPRIHDPPISVNSIQSKSDGGKHDINEMDNRTGYLSFREIMSKPKVTRNLPQSHTTEKLEENGQNIPQIIVVPPPSSESQVAEIDELHKITHPSSLQPTSSCNSNFFQTLTEIKQFMKSFEAQLSVMNNLMLEEISKTSHTTEHSGIQQSNINSVPETIEEFHPQLMSTPAKASTLQERKMNPEIMRNEESKSDEFTIHKIINASPKKMNSKHVQATKNYLTSKDSNVNKVKELLNFENKSKRINLPNICNVHKCEACPTRILKSFIPTRSLYSDSINRRNTQSFDKQNDTETSYFANGSKRNNASEKSRAARGSILKMGKLMIKTPAKNSIKIAEENWKAIHQDSLTLYHPANNSTQQPRPSSASSNSVPKNTVCSNED